MKLWQKATFLFVGVFLVGVIAISSVYLQKSRFLDEQIATTVVKNEFDMIKASLDPQLSEASSSSTIWPMRSAPPLRPSSATARLCFMQRQQRPISSGPGSIFKSRVCG